MPVLVNVGTEVVTVFEAGTITCTCKSGPLCAHIEAVVSGDGLLKPGPLAQALKLIDPDLRIQVLTKRLDAETNVAKRATLEVGIALLLKQKGSGR